MLQQMDIETTVVAKAFDLWMDEYLNHPEKFQQEAAILQKHLTERKNGTTPSYGESCAAALQGYIRRVS